MAKRRQLEIPSAEALKEIEEGFARETPSGPGLRPPIADVVADAAMRSDPLPASERADAARDKSDARQLREAIGKGLVAREIPIHEITADALTRDRIHLDEEDMVELCTSIATHGLRLPIEVFEPANPEAAGKYALISGFRRLAAVRRLNAMTGGEKHLTIAAFVRQPDSIADSVIAMVEENEIRTGLSQYERGRAAAMAVYDGVFPSLDEAVQMLFGSASKAKRSKIRSFALVHEELGDMLSFATHLNERQCLRLAAALRAGLAQDIRRVLEDHVIETPEAEWAALVPLVEQAEGVGPDPSRGGRPKAASKPKVGARIPLANGVSIERVERPDGYAIQFRGASVNSEMIDKVIDHIRYLLEEVTD
ncbi:ParB/RepB/Spo0J family partition protein [Roseovarius sp.]|uniref:ParB/RepB/Spo0J family partition protein n=1 Tax=Roseovarius sp. TaxID=1486281 RepID=UPI001D3B820E|nr:MAG: chromosome partitioning protein ParB [Sphingomonadales bacterium]